MNYKRFNNRGMLVLACFVFIFIIIGVQIFRIQILMHEKFSEKSKRQILRWVKERGRRGKILAATGEQLAYDTIESDLILNPELFNNLEKDKRADLLIYFSSFEKFDFLKELEKVTHLGEQKKKYYKILKNLSLEERDKIEEKLKELKIRGYVVTFEQRNKRLYIAENMLRSIVGYMGYSGDEILKKGRFGIEKSYENELAPKVVKVVKVVAGDGRKEIPVSKVVKDLDNPNGNSIVLTIDYMMQHIMQDEFDKFYRDFKPKWATGVIINPNNGEILAMVNLPNKSVALTKNAFIQNRYEPGSVMKPVIMASALDGNFVKDNDIFKNPDGRITKFGITMRDSSGGARGNLLPKDIIKKSSNVGMVMIADEMPKIEYEKYLKKFGFYDKTNIDFPGEPNSNQVPAKKWDGLKKYAMSFGQAIAVTPLQMTMAFAAVINGGKLYEPKLVKEIISEDGEVIKKVEPKLKNIAIKPEISKKLRKMLYSVIEEGSGKRARVEGYMMGGKTGTSQKSVNGKYSKENYTLSFAGFYPVNNPQYLCLIVADDPKSDLKYAGQIVAPLYARIMKRVFRYKSYIPSNRKVDKVTKINMPNKGEIGIAYNIMPNLVGLSERELLKSFKNKKMKIDIKGTGYVYKQSPKAGSVIKEKKITVFMREHN